ncbi:FtsX-like permease family protein [Flavobacterium agricola]|uniref:FtsX-like permease family protein n=1 Tax=Flavobacterium agricola TaxID=2870839 RepID=A0ABY6LZ31_9FLAO|nr:FtsX-like permease family protein [Flavobacterium agricola]UYW01541.1 FtsX-like permease family protein [Flavobacterium agricola]
MIRKLAWKNLWFKPLNTFLSVVLLTASVAIITLLILLQNQFDKKFNSTIDGIDMVLGAPGSPLQVILSSVYHIDAPTGNIDFNEAQKWMNNPFVAQAIPLSFGDNYLGYKILGTTPDYITKYEGKLEQGELYTEVLQVVVGGEIARNLNLKLGDTFAGSHGSSEHGDVHDEHPYTVVGILEKNGSILDNLILSNIETVWEVHDHEHEHHDEVTTDVVVHEDHEHDHDHEEHAHKHEEDKQITAVLLSFKNKMALFSWPRLIAENTKMQAVLPALEVNRLISMFGIGIDGLKYLAFGIMFLSGISIFIALYNRLKERKYEFALLRISGAKPFQLLKLVVIESVLLCLTGFIFGTIFGRLALYAISLSSQNEFNIAFNPFEIVWQNEIVLFVVTLFVGFISALIPAIKAYKLNISKTLANA